MRSRWYAVLFPCCVLASAGACNAITGQHDRFLDEGDSSVPLRSDSSADTDRDLDSGSSMTDAADGAPQIVTINVPHTWTTPNGAVYGPAGGGTSILEAGAQSHAVIVPSPVIAIPSDDYTVTATILAPTKLEFGVLVRGQADGMIAVYGSIYGTVTPAFLAIFGPPDWNPPRTSTGPDYTFTNGSRYTMKVRAVGSQITSKLWNAAQAEPAQWHASLIVPWATGKGIGFYVYMTATTGLPVLEKMVVTVP